MRSGDNTSSLDGDLRRAGLEGALDAIFNSSAMGVAKPAVGFFEHVLTSLECEVSDPLYVDDTEANVVAAQALGIRAHHHRDPEGTLEFLRRFLS